MDGIALCAGEWMPLEMCITKSSQMQIVWAYFISLADLRCYIYVYICYVSIYVVGMYVGHKRTCKTIGIERKKCGQIRTVSA